MLLFPSSSTNNSCLILSLLLLLLSTTTAQDVTTYFAKLQNIPGQGYSSLAGYAVVFADLASQSLSFTGSFINGLGSGLTRDDCTTGCNIAIYSGNSCESVQDLGSILDGLDGTQYAETNDAGGAMFAATNLVQVPQDQGQAQAQLDPQATLPFALNDMEGKIVVVTDPNGVKIGCGPLVAVNPSSLLMASTTGSAVTAKIVAMSLETQICFSGTATGLEPGLSSADCTNGCGIQILTGNECGAGDSYYNSEVLGADPWKSVKYTSTDASGTAVFTQCVETYESDYARHPITIYNKAGEAVSCGNLEIPGGDLSYVPGESIQFQEIGLDDLEEYNIIDITSIFQGLGFSDVTSVTDVITSILNMLGLNFIVDLFSSLLG